MSVLPVYLQSKLVDSGQILTQSQQIDSFFKSGWERETEESDEELELVKETEIKMINDLPLYQSCKVVEGTYEDEDKDDGEWITVQKKHEWKTCGKGCRIKNRFIAHVLKEHSYRIRNSDPEPGTGHSLNLEQKFFLLCSGT